MSYVSMNYIISVYNLPIFAAFDVIQNKASILSSVITWIYIIPPTMCIVLVTVVCVKHS